MPVRVCSGIGLVCLALFHCQNATGRVLEKPKKVVHQPGRGCKGDELSVGFGCIRFGEKKKVGKLGTIFSILKLSDIFFQYEYGVIIK